MLSFDFVERLGMGYVGLGREVVDGRHGQRRAPQRNGISWEFWNNPVRSQNLLPACMANVYPRMQSNYRGLLCYYGQRIASLAPNPKLLMPFHVQVHRPIFHMHLNAKPNALSSS